MRDCRRNQLIANQPLEKRYAHDNRDHRGVIGGLLHAALFKLLPNL